MVMKFDLKGVALSSGSACSSARSRPATYSVPWATREQAQSALRFSTGWNSTPDDVAALTRVQALS